MPGKPTKDTVAVNIELPTELMDRVRDFARRDMRSIKMEFIRALHLLLDTYDRPNAAAAETVALSEPSSATTVTGETPPSLSMAGQKSGSFVAQMDANAFALFSERLRKRKGPLYDIAACLRQGLTAQQIVNEKHTLQLPQVQLLIEELEKEARKAARGKT